MKVLVFGAKGWIGQQFISNTQHEIFEAITRPENYQDSFDEIQQINPDCVISFLGRTYGKNSSGTLIPSIDYLELPGKLCENMRDNFYAPYNLASICEKQNIHFIYLGTGCIYTYTQDKKIFTEDDKPNFFGSGYSTVKGYTDQVLRNFNNTLQLRIRMPISKLVSGRNLIDKLLGYPNICSIPNSMTVLDDMWSIIDKMIDVKEKGVYNLTNPGTIEHNWILEEYNKYFNLNHKWNIISYDEQMKYINSERSNNELDTSRLKQFCQKHNIELLEIKESILRCIQRRKNINYTDRKEYEITSKDFKQL
jgi:nucleoside-diphosphate-sugar epimerase